MSLKMFLAGLVVAAFAAVSLNAVAEEAGVKKASQELTLTGKIILKEDVKGDVKATDKVGKTEEVVKIKASETIILKYALVEADGTEVALPEPKAKPGQKAIDLESFVGKSVKLVAKGKVKADGKKHVTSIVSVTEEAAPAATPVAPEAAPAAPAAPAVQ